MIRLLLATINVLTLADHDAAADARRGGRPAAEATGGLAMPGRTELLEVELERGGVILAGLQEARAKQAGMRTGKRYLAIRSAGVRGTLGCELWASRELPYATVDGKEQYFAAEHFFA